MPPDVRSGARERLATRQSAVLDALLAGRVPAGFDPRTALATGETLVGKRFGEARAVVPELTPYRAEFLAWARTHPRDGCACADARAFARDRAHDCARLRHWLRTREVYDRARRVALVRAVGRWELVVGVRNTVLHLALRQPREDTWERS